MKIKPKNSKRKYIPVTLSESLSGINKKFLYKFGKLDYTIHTKWGDIVGNFFINHTEPLRITSIPQSTNEDGSTIYERHLHVNVSPAAAIEFQHFQDKIIEKINSYFGYKAIKSIKIQQQLVKKVDAGKLNHKTNLIEKEIDKKEVLESTPTLSNKKLEESIVKLGLSITNEKK